MTSLETHGDPDRLHQSWVLASPILVVLIGSLAARFFMILLHQWAWVGTSAVYWSSMLIVIWRLSPGRARKDWFGRSKGSKGWAALAVGMGFVSFPLLLIPNLRVMNSAPLVAAWFSFALLNSICEEAYWRGFLLDELACFPRLFGVGYSTILFAAIHPLMLGAFSRIQSYDPAAPMALIPFALILVSISLSYSLIYLKTKSLRWPILSHFLSDLGNLSIFLFMNMLPA